MQGTVPSPYSGLIITNEKSKANVNKKSVKEILCIFFYIFALFQDPIEAIVPSIQLFDEIVFAVVSFCATCLILKRNFKIKRHYMYIIFLCFGIVLIGLCGNCLTGYQSDYLAILKDIIAFLKFPLGFISFMYFLHDVRRNSIFKTCSTISKIFIVTCFLFGVLSIVFPNEILSHDFRHGIWSYRFVYSHPTFLVVCLVLCFASIVAVNQKFDIYKLLCLITLVLTMRDKAFAFVALVLLVYFVKMENKKRLFPYIILSLVVIGVVAFPKISEYMMSASSPREALYANGFKMANMHFPFGGGLASWASSLSGEYYSSAYSFFGIDIMDGLRPDAFYDMGDAGYAYYIGEYGWVGLIGFLLVLYLIFTCVYRYSLPDSGIRISIICVFGYLISALTVEAVLTNASGIELAFVLVLLNNERCQAVPRFNRY